MFDGWMDLLGTFLIFFKKEKDSFFILIGLMWKPPFNLLQEERLIFSQGEKNDYYKLEMIGYLSPITL